MKKLLSILTIFTLLSFTAFAQNQSPDDSKNGINNKHNTKQGKKDRKKMMKEMDLSKQQKMQMKKFMKSNKSRKEEIQNDKSLTVQQRKEKMMVLRREHQEKMNTIFTPDQREKMKEKMKYQIPGKKQLPTVIRSSRFLMR